MPNPLIGVFANDLLRAATIDNPDGTSTVDDKYLAQVIVSSQKALTDLQENAASTISKQRAEAIKRRVEFDASVRRLIGTLQNTAGKERGDIIKAAQQDLANIRDNYVKLVSENPAVIGSVTSKTEQAVVAANNTPQARADGWDMLLGDLNNLGVVSAGNPEVIAIYRWAEKRLGDPEDPSFVGDEDLRRRALEFKRIAADAENQKTIAGRELDAQLGALTSSITGLAGQKDLNAAIATSVAQLNQLNTKMEDFRPPPAADFGAEVQLFLDNTKQYNEMIDFQKNATTQFFGAGSTSGDSLHDALAKMVGSKHFQQWAKSNGYDRLGQISYKEDGSIDLDSYIPSKQDIKAAWLYNWQRQKPVESPLFRHNTDRWVKLTIKEKAAGAAVQNSEAAKSILQAIQTTPDAAGREPSLTPDGKRIADSNVGASSLYAYTEDDGERVYLDGAQLDAIAKTAFKPTLDPIAFADADGDSYVYFPGDEDDDGKPDETAGQLFEWTKDGWRPSSKSLTQVGQSIEKFSGQLAVRKDGDGWSIPTPEELVKLGPDDVAPATEEVQRSIDGNRLKSALEKTGVVLSTSPPETPTYSVYGKEIRMHATDPLGSFRVRTNGGERLYTKDQLAGVTTTLDNSRTPVPVAISRVIGRRDEQIAQELRYPYKRDKDEVRQPESAPPVVEPIDKTAAPLGEGSKAVQSANGGVVIPLVRDRPNVDAGLVKAVGEQRTAEATKQPTEPPASQPAKQPPVAPVVLSGNPAESLGRKIGQALAGPEKKVEAAMASAAKAREPASAASTDSIDLKPSTPVFDSEVELKRSMPVFDETAPTLDASIVAASGAPALQTGKDKEGEGADPNTAVAPDALPASRSLRRARLSALLGARTSR